VAEPALGTVDTLPPEWEVTRLVQRLRAQLPELRVRYGLESVALFGSYVRNEQRPDSDLDLLATFSRTPTLFDLVEVEDDLKERLGVPLDLVLRSEAWAPHPALHPARGGNGMRPNQANSIYLAHISEAIERAQRFLGDMPSEQFTLDEPISHATVRQLQIIGEAAKRLPSEIRALDPHIPWSDMARTRDRIIHGYDKVDLAVVWHTAQHDLPPLLPRLQQVLEQREDEEWERE